MSADRGLTDSMIIVTAENATIRCLVASSRTLVQEAATIHGTSPVVTAALGRALTAGGIMTHMLGEGEKLTLQWLGDGPIGKVIVIAEPDGLVRGYATNPQIDTPLKAAGKLDVGQAVGNDGFLYVMKDLGVGQPYSGSVPLVSGEIAEDLARYFAESEQTPSVVSLGVLVGVDASVSAAGGFIIQAMPGIDEQALARLERTIGVMPPISSMLSSGMSVFDIANRLMSGLEHHVIGEQSLSYRCPCSRERIERVLLTLGEDDLRHLSETEDDVQVNCDFCKKLYEFTQEELSGLQSDIDSH